MLSLAAWLVMGIACFAFPVAFSSYLVTDAAAPAMYWISESAGIYGTSLLIILICTGIAFAVNGIGKKILYFFITLLAMGALLGGLAAFNERVVKPSMAAPRPSHTYLSEKGLIKLEEFYALDVEDRTKALRWATRVEQEKVADIYPAILEHWIFESGFSFPSGHSQNAFLLATLVAAIGFHLLKRRMRYLMLIPVAWAVLVCVSRVAIGIHTKYDVVAGAGIGMLIAFIIILSGLIAKAFSSYAVKK